MTEAGEQLWEIGELYRSAAGSQEPPDLLARFGGIMALAGRDADELRYRKVMGIIPWQRDPTERNQRIRVKWQGHSRNIQAIMKRDKSSPYRAAQTYLEETLPGIRPMQPPNVVRDMMTASTSPSGSLSGVRWLNAIEADRERWARETAIMMSGPIAAAVTGTTEMVTGDRELAFGLGSMVKTAGDIIGALPSRKRPQDAIPADNFRGASINRSPRLEPVARKEDRGLSSGRPLLSDRGTTGPAPVSRRNDRSLTSASGPWGQGLSFDRQPKPNHTRMVPSNLYAPVPRGGKWTPMRRTAREYAQKFLDRLPSGKVDAGASMDALEDIFRRTHGGSKSGHGLTYLQTRAAAMELEMINRAALDPTVFSVRILSSTRSGRSPDILVERIDKLRIVQEHWEATTITGATRTHKPVKGEQAPRTALRAHAIDNAVLRKVRDTPDKPSQLRNERRIGGRVAVFVPFTLLEPSDLLAEAYAAMQRLGPKLRDKAFLQGVDIIGVEERENPSEAGMRDVVSFRRQVDGSWITLQK